MFKINYLDIKYFKFFSDTDKIELEEKNLLIFGENGSGKSTIYWALYTFLQSSLKTDNAISDYFKQSTNESINEKSLVNIYESDDNKSYIKLNLKDSNTESNFIISKDISVINTNEASNSLIANANLASDFISYKYLFRFFNFLHRDDIDLFPLFSYEILQFLSKDTVNLSELWNEILTLIKSKPRKNDKVFNRKLTLFNNLLTDIIFDLNIPTDNYLKQFKYQDLKLKLSVISGVYNGKELIPPKINLEIIVKKNDTNEIKIHRPQSYFNEAKLTAMEW
jgi:energy-coupling factor transporter ATP-binding protein EcfA2